MLKASMDVDPSQDGNPHSRNAYLELSPQLLDNCHLSGDRHVRSISPKLLLRISKIKPTEVAFRHPKLIASNNNPNMSAVCKFVACIVQRCQPLEVENYQQEEDAAMRHYSTGLKIVTHIVVFLTTLSP